MTPKDVMNSTTDQVKKVIDEVLRIERSYKHIQNLSANKTVESKISEEIYRAIAQEIQ